MTSMQIGSSTETSPLSGNSNHNLENWEDSLMLRPSHGLTLFQLLKEIYLQTIGNPAAKALWPVKTRSLSLYFKLKETILQKGLQSNVYNDLIMYWLRTNMPFKTTPVKFGEFKKYVDSKQKSQGLDETLLTNFYQNAIAVWSGLIEPSIEEIKNACVIVVAKTLAPSSYDLEEVLSNTFLNTINLKDGFASQEEFIYLVRNFPEAKYTLHMKPQQLRKICEEFYTFGKRFIMVDFPMSAVGVSPSSLLKLSLKDATDRGLHTTFDLLEYSLDRFVSWKYGVELDGQVSQFSEKNIYLLKSMVLLSKIKQTKNLTVDSLISTAKENRIYMTLNSTFGIEEKYANTLKMLNRGNVMLETYVLKPTLSFISVSIDRTKDTVVIILDGLESHLKIQSMVEGLLKKFQFLKDMTVRQYRRVVEIKAPMEILKVYGAEIKEEVVYLYKELKDLNLQKFQFLTAQFYSKAFGQPKPQRSLPESSNVKERNI